jgi:amicyanin
MMRTLLVFSIVAVSAMLLLVFGLSAAASGRSLAGSSEDQKDAQRVTIDNFSFAPATLTVPAGTKVTWTNRDDVPHNVISVDKKFASPVLDTDEEFSYSFTDPGTYEYYCSIHPKMTGKVIVQ